MVLKIMGSLMIIISSAYLGFAFSNEYLKEIEVLNSFERMLVLLKGEISYSSSTVNEAMIKAGKNCDDTCKIFLDEVIKNFNHKKMTLSGSWEKALNNKSIKKNLGKCQYTILKEFGDNLGVSDKATQLENFDRAKEQINIHILELKSKKNEKCKMYRIFGFLSGLFITIILI